MVELHSTVRRDQIRFPQPVKDDLSYDASMMSDASSATSARSAPELSIVAAAQDEVENLESMVSEVFRVVGELSLSFELIIVDDRSTDGSLDLLRALMKKVSELRVVSIAPDPANAREGKSAALREGIRRARGSLIVTMDADLQDDPADIGAMLEAMRQQHADLVQGDRSHLRRDTIVRRISSRVGRYFRHWLLHDPVRDTGCGLRVLRREVAQSLPLECRGMHRFIPILSHHMGYHVIEVPVKHRPRTAGKAKYGIWNRALPGLIDCLAVRWMRSRRSQIDATELTPSPRKPPSTAPARQEADSDREPAGT